MTAANSIYTTLTDVTVFLTETPARQRLTMLAALSVLAIGSAPVMVMVHAAVIAQFGVAPLAVVIAVCLLACVFLPLARSGSDRT